MTRGILRRVRTLFRDAKGVNFIEAALATPLLLLLTFGIIDFASLLYTYLALENGVSLASRYGVTGNLMDDPMNPGSKLSRQESIKAAMRASTPTLTVGDSAFSFAHMPTNGTAWLAGIGGPGDVEKVTVNYTFRLMTPLLRPFFTGGQINFTVDSSMKNENYQ